MVGRSTNQNVRNTGQRWSRHGCTWFAFIGFVATATIASAENWPQWGGPRRDFKVTSGLLADHWDAGGPKRIWERDLGPGYSAIVAVDGHLYTGYRDNDDEVFVALDAGTGKTLWEFKYAAPSVENQVLEFGKGPNATPLVVGDQIYTIGFTGVMHCLNRADGKKVWSRDFVKDFDGKVFEFGYSSSPLFYKGNVIVLVGGEKHGVVALHPKDGAVVWASEPHDVSYASPIVINVDGQDQIVFFSSEAVMGLDASNGKHLWEHPVINQYKNNATDAIWGDDNLLWAATQLEGGGRMLRLKRDGDKTSVKEEWFNPKAQVFHWNAVRVGEFIYAAIGGRVTSLAGFSVKTGEIAWQERGFTKSLCVFADDKLITLDEDGSLSLSRVSPRGVEKLSSTQLTEKNSWTVPTLVGSTLFVRDTKRIMALDLR